MKDNQFGGGRSLDASEFLLANGLIDALDASQGVRKRVTYHDACHLAHGQRVTQPPRELLKAIPGIDLVDLNESDMCCGSAGIYNVTQPKMARQLLERKYANIAATGAEIVAMGNPGCHAWIAQAAREHGGSVQVMHTMELLEASFN
jgi:glycolate oxidase iron-sulfur subunit